MNIKIKITIRIVFFTLLFLSIINFLQAQTFTQIATASDGGFYKQISGSLQFTIGEPIVESYSNSSVKLCQGFEQGNYSHLGLFASNTIERANINIFPNPAYTFTSISFSSNADCLYVIKLYDSHGKLILEKEINSKGADTIDLCNFASGIYLVNIPSADNQFSKTIKLIKQ